MSKKLLLADDSITIQKVIGITFANEDYELAIVDNGDAALERARSLRPDLILADVFMPGKNGYELCAAVKQDPILSHIPLLLLTGTFEPFDENKARAAGADSWIAKPFESQALIERVEELLARVPQPGVSAAAPVSPPPVAPPDEPEFAAAAWAEAAEPEAFAFPEEEMPEAWAAPPATGTEALAEDDIWGSLSFDEADLLAEPAVEEAAEDIWGAMAEEAPVGVEPPAPAEEPFAESFLFEEEPLPHVEAPLPVAPAAVTADEEFLFEEEPPAAPASWTMDEEDVFALDEVDILEEEELGGMEEAAAEEFLFAEEREPFVGELEPAPELDAMPAFVPELPAEEEFALTEEGPEWGVAEAPAAIELAAPATEEFLITSAEAAMEPPPVVKPTAMPVVAQTVEERVSTLSDEDLARIVEQVAGSVIERLAGTLLEKIAWEVVPDLAESLIKEEIRKIREGAQ